MSAPRAQSPIQELSADNIQIQVNINSDKRKSDTYNRHLDAPSTSRLGQPAFTRFHANSVYAAIKLNVRPEHTVTNVLEFLSASTGVLPSDVKLLLNSQPLNPSSTVAELSLSSTSTLELSPPVTQSPIKPATTKTSTPRKSNKPRCSKQGCKGAAQPIVGDCGFCQQRFCGKHRMLESHNCTGLDDARQADKDRNAAKLESERTIALHGL